MVIETHLLHLTYLRYWQPRFTHTLQVVFTSKSFISSSHSRVDHFRAHKHSGLCFLSFFFLLSLSLSLSLSFPSQDTKLDPCSRGKRTGSDAQLRDERKHERYRQGHRVTEYRPIELHSSDLPHESDKALTSDPTFKEISHFSHWIQIRRERQSRGIQAESCSLTRRMPRILLTSQHLQSASKSCLNHFSVLSRSLFFYLVLYLQNMNRKNDFHKISKNLAE